MIAPAGKSKLLEHTYLSAPLVFNFCVQEAERSFTERRSTGIKKALMGEYSTHTHDDIPLDFSLLSCDCCAFLLS